MEWGRKVPGKARASLTDRARAAFGADDKGEDGKLNDNGQIAQASVINRIDRQAEPERQVQGYAAADPP